MRSVTVPDDVADALEAAMAAEGGEQNFGAVGPTVAALGGGILSLLPIVLKVLPTLLSLLGNENLKGLLAALPSILAALKAGDLATAITLLAAVFQPKPA